MVEQPPPQKNDEEDPLLKMETGGGDIGHGPPHGTRWSVNCASRKSWIDRWPELFSACWMAGMLLGIFVLIIYGLGSFGVIRRSPIFLMTCNDSKTATAVHYHYLVEEGVDVPFEKLSRYLTFMRTEYPGLHFNVVFLINDVKGYRRTPQYKKDDRLRELRSFRNYHLKYHSMSVTITTLSKYLLETPWKLKWRKIHMPYILFYLRVYSVWKKGGISMQLGTYGDQSCLRLVENPTIDTILRKYSNGFKAEEYTETFNQDKQSEFASLFYGMVHQLLNETRNFLNRSLHLSDDHTEKHSHIPIVRTHRNKREVLENALNVTDQKFFANKELGQGNLTAETVTNSSNRNNSITLELDHNDLLSMFGFVHPSHNETDTPSHRINGSKHLKNLNHKTTIPLKNESDVSQDVIFYGFSIFSENMGLPNIFPDMLVQPSFPDIFIGNYEEPRIVPEVTSPKKNSTYALTIALDGSFIAAPVKNHPFLFHLISTACQRMPPRIAIQDAIISQCSSIIANNDYCSNIYLI